MRQRCLKDTGRYYRQRLLVSPDMDNNGYVSNG
jgi:hypothetical protein